MRANEYALNSSAYGSASAPIQQALRTHLDEAAELLRDLRGLHHNYPAPEVRWPLAAALRDAATA
jgi:hypothetical protein